MTTATNRISGLAQAVAKIIESPHNRRVSLARCTEQIAAHLDAMGEPSAASLVREALVKHGASLGTSYALANPKHEIVDRHDPKDLAEEFVLDDALRLRLDRLVAELAQAPKLLASGIDAPTRVFLHGPSGTGKTLAVRWLGGCLGLPVAVVRLDRTTDSHMGVTAQNLAKAMEVAEACPTILFLDEVDGICGNRANLGSDVGEQGRITSALFQQLDALPPSQVVVAATNYKDRVDPALVRRFPCEVLFDLPDGKARGAMIERWWAKVPHTPGALIYAVGHTFELSGAQTRAFAMAAARAALLAGEVLEVRHVEAVCPCPPPALDPPASLAWPGGLGQ